MLVQYVIAFSYFLLNLFVMHSKEFPEKHRSSSNKKLEDSLKIGYRVAICAKLFVCVCVCGGHSSVQTCVTEGQSTD